MKRHLSFNVDRLNRLNRIYGWGGSLLNGSEVVIGNYVAITLVIFHFSLDWRIGNGKITRNSCFSSPLYQCLDHEESWRACLIQNN